MCNFISNISKQILFSSAVVLSVVFFYPQIVFAGGGGGVGGGDGSGATVQEAIRDARNNAARRHQGQPDGFHVIRQSDGSYVAHNQFDGGGNGSGMQLDFSDICTAQPGCRVTGDGNCTCNPPPPPPPPPTVSISAVINDDSENEHTGTTDIYVLPIDTVEINWSSQDATSCQGQFDLQGHVNDTEGSYTLDLDEITPGETRQYQVSCTRTVGHQPSAPGTSGTISVTLLGLDLNLSLDREIIRAGETVTMDWDVSFPDGAEATAHGNNLPDTLDCDLAGAIRQEIDIQANPNGSATSGPIFNFFNNRLRCVYPDSVHEFSVTTPLEVIPAPRER